MSIILCILHIDIKNNFEIDEENALIEEKRRRNSKS